METVVGLEEQKTVFWSVETSWCHEMSQWRQDNYQSVACLLTSLRLTGTQDTSGDRVVRISSPLDHYYIR